MLKLQRRWPGLLLASTLLLGGCAAAGAAEIAVDAASSQNVEAAAEPSVNDLEQTAVAEELARQAEELAREAELAAQQAEVEARAAAEAEAVAAAEQEAAEQAAAELAAAEQELAAHSAAQAASLGLAPAIVTRVIDGDTIEINLGGVSERVRLVGIDAPESNAPGGSEATAFTGSHLPVGAQIWLQSDGNDRDRFDRLRRHIWLAVPTSLADAEQRSQLHLGQMLLAAGHATIWGTGVDGSDNPAASNENPPAASGNDNPDHGITRFRNCTHVWEVLGRPIRAGEQGFHSGLDRDNDGVGCERRP